MEAATQDESNLPTYDGCYVCGQEHPRGLRVRFRAGSGGEVSAAFEPDAAQTGYDNVVHGGVLSALLDELIGWAVALRHDRMACTAELTLRFVKPVLLGARYLARARVEAGRGSCWEASGELADENGVIYAKGRGKYFLFSATRTAEVAAKMTYQSGDLPVFRRRTEN